MSHREVWETCEPEDVVLGDEVSVKFNAGDIIRHNRGIVRRIHAEGATVLSLYSRSNYELYDESYGKVFITRKVAA